jgi:predicted DNA-binding protein
MKNVTLAVPDETLERFRSYAARQGRTVNALVREYMEKATGRDEADRRASVERLRALAAQTAPAEFAPSLTRDEIWDRQER